MIYLSSRICYKYVWENLTLSVAVHKICFVEVSLKYISFQSISEKTSVIQHCLIRCLRLNLCFCVTFDEISNDCNIYLKSDQITDVLDSSPNLQNWCGSQMVCILLLFIDNPLVFSSLITELKNSDYQRHHYEREWVMLKPSYCFTS